MGFAYKGKTVNINNYKDIFKSCSVDIKDEIRSAILDDTPIGDFIESCGTNSYKLGQIRMAIRDNLDPDFISSEITGTTIYYIRQGISWGKNMYPLLKYYDKKSTSIDADDIEKLAMALSMSIAIDKVDFMKVQKSLVDITIKGLAKGYPMWLMVMQKNMSVDKVRTLLRGLQCGVDIHYFLDEDWDLAILNLLFNNAEQIDLNKFISYISYRFDYGLVEELLDLYKKGIDITKLSVKDTSGYPVYNVYQVIELSKVVENNLTIEGIFNPQLSDMTMASMIKEHIKK